MIREPLAPERLVEEGYSTVIVASPDLQGRLVGRRVPAESFARVMREGIQVCTCVYAWDIAQDASLIKADVFPLCGMHNGIPDTTYLPDLATLRPAAWLSGVAICLADPVDALTGESLPISPRTILRRELEEYDALKLRPQTGTELEFYLFLNEPRALRLSGFTDALEPTTLTPSDFLIHEGNGYEGFFQKLRADLSASGIEIESAQSEFGRGQWEITFRYTDPLEMADRHALYKLAVRDSAAAAGMSATFMAKPVTADPGSSCHIHLSLMDEDGTSAFWADDAPDHFSETMKSGIAGTLDHLSDYMGWYAPTINSYRRANNAESAGSGRTWGIENRSTTVRVIGHTSSDFRFEFRLPGADTNPYLALTALLSSVRDGLERHSPLPDITIGDGAASPTDSDIPNTLGDAAKSMSQSEFARRRHGDETIDHFAILLEHEWRTFLAATTNWDIERYFDRI